MSGASQSNDKTNNADTSANPDQVLTQSFIKLRDELGKLGVVAKPDSQDFLTRGAEFPVQFSEGAQRLMEGPVVDITGVGLSEAENPAPGPAPTSPGRFGRIFSTPGANEPKED